MVPRRVGVKIDGIVSKLQSEKARERQKIATNGTGKRVGTGKLSWEFKLIDMALR